MSDKNDKPEKTGSNWTGKAALAGAAIGSAAIAAALLEEIDKLAARVDQLREPVSGDEEDLRVGLAALDLVAAVDRTALGHSAVAAVGNSTRVRLDATWPSGDYVARLRWHGHTAYAPFVLRPKRLDPLNPPPVLDRHAHPHVRGPGQARREVEEQITAWRHEQETGLRHVGGR